MLKALFLVFCLLALGSVNAQTIDQNAVIVRFQVLFPGASVVPPQNLTFPDTAFFNSSVASTFVADAIANGTNINSISANICMDQMMCDPNAMCTITGNHQYQCTCNTGYTDISTLAIATRNPPTTLVPPGTACNETNECLSATACGVVGAGNCTNTVGSFTCACNTGYNVTGNTCTDFDECAAGAHNCGMNADCINSNGSFSCVCSTGYTGNGFGCNDTDECLLSTTCGGRAISTCTNSIGNFSCSCVSGYSNATVTACIDEDECTMMTDNCDGNATCTNAPGNFSCACNMGYMGNGTLGNCADIDECGVSPTLCDSNAACANSVGSFTCTCNNGFQGNGTSCTALPSINYCYTAQFVTAETLTGTVAGRAALVEANITSIFETLRADSSLNFFYNTTTVTLNELQLPPSNSGTQFVATACFIQNTQSADDFTAILQNFNHSTLQIDGFQVMFAGDIDECAEFSNCTHIATPTRATCVNTNGSYLCMCNEEFYDTSASPSTENGTSCSLPLNFTCSINSLTVNVVIPYLNNLGINETEVFIGSCTTGVVSGDTLTFSGICNPINSDNGTHIISSWNLTNDNPSATIIAGRYITFPISCSFPKTANATTNITSAIDQNFIDAVGLVPGGDSGSAGLTISPYLGANFNSPLGGTRVRTGEELTFRIQESNRVDPLTSIRVLGLTAEPLGGSSNLQLRLLDNGCRSTSSNLEQINPLVNTVSTGEGSVTLLAFFFRGFSTTRLTFEIEICLRTSLSDTRCANPACPAGKRRRSIVSFRMKRADDVTVSATFARDPSDECNRDCGQGVCVVDFDSVEQCFCAESSVKTDEGNCAAITLPEEPEEPAVDDSQSVTLYVLIGLGCLLFILIVLAVFIVLFRRKSKAQKEYQLDYVNTNAIKS